MAPSAQVNQCEAAPSGTGIPTPVASHSIVAEEIPTYPRESTNDQGWSPAPTVTQKEQQKISQVELFLDGQCPENSVDAVTGMGIEVVKHQEMHHHVVYKKVSNVDAGGERRHAQKEG